MVVYVTEEQPASRLQAFSSRSMPYLRFNDKTPRQEHLVANVRIDSIVGLFDKPLDSPFVPWRADPAGLEGCVVVGRPFHSCLVERRLVAVVFLYPLLHVIALGYPSRAAEIGECVRDAAEEILHRGIVHRLGKAHAAVGKNANQNNDLANLAGSLVRQPQGISCKVYLHLLSGDIGVVVAKFVGVLVVESRIAFLNWV